MKKILYITAVNRSLASHKGFEKKVINQWKAFNNINKIECDIIYVEGIDVILQNSKDERFEKFTLKNKYDRNMNYFKNIAKKVDLSGYTYIYIRYPLSTRDLITFCKNTKNIGLMNIIEIVTYPYDNEHKKVRGTKIIQKYLDLRYRKQLINCIDYIVTFSDHNTIFGVPCINISNGINLEETSLVDKKSTKEIVFTSVASYEYWHGIDRFLESLDKKKSNEKILFNIVGEGNYIEQLKQRVDKSKNLANIVVFHGFKSGEELDEIYNATDIAVGSLGRHRSGLTSLKTLKNREYAAKGLPMIYSEIDTDFENQPFVYKITPDEALIDLDKVIAWYQKLDMQPEEIREYAKQFSWDNQMKKVIDAIGTK